MHILHVIDSLAIGGAERMVVDLANCMIRDAYQVSVCITRSNIDLASDLNEKINLIVLNRKQRFDLSAMKKFAKLVNEQHIDIIHAHMRTTLAFLALIKTAGFIKTPIILHDHYGIEYDCSVPFWFKFWGKYYLNAYVGVYENLTDWSLKAGVPENKTRVIENAIELSRIKNAESIDLREDLKISGEHRIGIVIGGFRVEKGIDVLIKAIGLCKNTKKIKIILVGGERDTKYMHYCKRLIAERELQDTFIFLGERSDVPNLLKSVDFAILPSLSESGPLVLIEYITAGLPFIASKVGAIAHQVADLSIPEFIAPKNVDALSKAVDRLLSASPDQLRKRGQIGRDKVLNQFDIRKTIKQWYELYTETMDTRR